MQINTLRVCTHVLNSCLRTHSKHYQTEVADFCSLHLEYFVEP